MNAPGCRHGHIAHTCTACQDEAVVNGLRQSNTVLRENAEKWLAERDTALAEVARLKEALYEQGIELAETRALELNHEGACVRLKSERDAALAQLAAEKARADDAEMREGYAHATVANLQDAISAERAAREKAEAALHTAVQLAREAIDECAADHATAWVDARLALLAAIEAKP